jgi:hypothetical protein
VQMNSRGQRLAWAVEWSRTDLCTEIDDVGIDVAFTVPVRQAREVCGGPHYRLGLTQAQRVELDGHHQDGQACGCGSIHGAEFP